MKEWLKHIRMRVVEKNGWLRMADTRNRYRRKGEGGDQGKSRS